MTTKLLKTAIIVSALFASSAFAGPKFGPGTSGVRVTVNDGVATIYGNVESGIDKVLVERKVREMEGITKVCNRLFVSN